MGAPWRCSSPPAILLGIAQSRIAMLDIFVAAWTTLCLLAALRFVQDGERLRWLVATGIAGGLAVSTKWSGALALLAAAAIVVMVRALPKVGRADAATSPDRRPRRSWWNVSALGVLCLVVLPAAIYVVSYAQYFASGHSLADFRELHSQMWHWNLTLHAHHSYASQPPTWLIDYRPVWYLFIDQGETYRALVAMGNPFLWWASAAALVAAPLFVPWFATTARRSSTSCCPSRRSSPCCSSRRGRAARQAAEPRPRGGARPRGARRDPVPALVRHHTHVVPLLHDARRATHGRAARGGAVGARGRAIARADARVAPPCARHRRRRRHGDRPVLVADRATRRVRLLGAPRPRGTRHRDGATATAIGVAVFAAAAVLVSKRLEPATAARRLGLRRRRVRHRRAVPAHPDGDADLPRRLLPPHLVPKLDLKSFVRRSRHVAGTATLRAATARVS